MAEKVGRNPDRQQASGEAPPLRQLQHEIAAAEREVKIKLADTRLTADLQAALTDIAPATALRVNVDTSHGIVHLRGEVVSEEQRAEAERIVRSVGPPGIRRIVNELRVNPEMPPLPHP